MLDREYAEVVCADLAIEVANEWISPDTLGRIRKRARRIQRRLDPQVNHVQALALAAASQCVRERFDTLGGPVGFKGFATDWGAREAGCYYPVNRLDVIDWWCASIAR